MALLRRAVFRVLIGLNGWTYSVWCCGDSLLPHPFPGTGRLLCRHHESHYPAQVDDVPIFSSHGIHVLSPVFAVLLINHGLPYECTHTTYKDRTGVAVW